MANLLDQMIEQISREKHIEPGVIVAAIEDAMVVAARKYYKTDEDLRAKFNAETGQVDVYSVRAVVDEVLHAAGRGHPAARKAVESVARWAGIGLANLVNCLNPEMVVLGGFLADLLELAGPEIRAQMRAGLTRAEVSPP